LAPLGSLPHVHFFSLQKGAGEDEAAHPPASLSVTDLAPQIGDFADSAAIISKLDLVITVDTAVAHLAGALGRRCWVLLPDYKPDWRWLAGRDDSPWYPGVMRLFRQDATGAWDPVIAAIKRQLSELSAQRP
jgi:ADP-heptose:LPS heptosyltransferase